MTGSPSSVAKLAARRRRRASPDGFARQGRHRGVRAQALDVAFDVAVQQGVADHHDSGIWRLGHRLEIPMNDGSAVGEAT